MIETLFVFYIFEFFNKIKVSDHFFLVLLDIHTPTNVKGFCRCSYLGSVYEENVPLSCEEDTSLPRYRTDYDPSKTLKSSSR